MSTEPQATAELFWQAFRYASDEMAAAEREAFEAVLATDQPAREAVARVVELEGLVRTAENTPVEIRRAPLSVLPIERNYWMQPLGWVAVGAAACLATVMAFQAWWPTAGTATSQPTQVAVGNLPRGSAAASELALAWAQAQAEVPASDDSLATGSEAMPIEAAGDAVLSPAIEHDLASAGDDSVAAAPDWLLAAVADAEAAHAEN